jgi:hypothetical protein
MKQEIQLYINGQRADLFNDETIQVTSSIQNVKDIAKVFTDYSQTFTLPASQANNKIFQHYYNPDVVNGFDARFKVDAVIEINYQPFRSGKIKLEGVDLKDNVPYAYKVTFFGSIVNLKDLLGEDQLDGLNWLSNFDTVHSYDNIKAYLQSGRDFTVDSVYYSDAIIAPLISANQRWYYDTATNITGSGNLQTTDSGLRGAYYKDFKYAIRLYVLIKAIEKNYTTANGYPTNIVFSDDFFSTSNSAFYGLYMWMHREKGSFGAEEGAISTYLNTMPVENWQGVYMNSNNFSIFDIFSYSAQYYSFTLNLNVSSSAATFDVYLERDGSVVESKLANTGSTSYALSFANLTSNGNYKIRIDHTTAFDIRVTSPATNIQMTRGSVSGNTSNTFTFTALQSLTTDANFSITDNIPEMKVIDFLTALFKMFNLTAYERDGEIVVKPLSDFYDSGSTFNITEYVDMSQSSVSPSTLFKQINFKYDGLGTLFALNHKEQFNLDWATEQYALEDKYDGETYDVSVPFEHTKYERLYDSDGSSTTIQWGWMVDKLNEDGSGTPYIGKPLVFYVLIGSTSIRVRNDSSFDTISSYYKPSNSSASNDGYLNINFKAELNEYTNTVFTQTLFNNYYSDYISDVFNPQTRITKVTAYLPIKILTQYKLEDTFIVGDRAYKINSITSDLTNGKSEIELINIV